MLSIAIAGHCSDVIEPLVAAGASFECGMPIVMKATLGRHVATLRALLRAGADPNAFDTETALMLACERDYEDCVHALVVRDAGLCALL